MSVELSTVSFEIVHIPHLLSNLLIHIEFVVLGRYNARPLLYRVVAQLAEQRSPKPQVGGSSPSYPAISYRDGVDTYTF